MIKKLIIKGITFLLIFSIILPINVFAEELTFGQLQDDLAKAQKELNANNQSINNNKNQINQNNSTINSLNNKIEEMSKEATKLQQEIADANIEIDKRKEQTKNLVVYLQMSQGENAYLEYVFGGDSITDLVYRLSIVEQITEHNNTMVKELEELINANENRKVELAKKEEEHKNTIDRLNTEINKLNSSVQKLGELSPSLEQEVKSKKEIVAYYKTQGCSKRSDVIGRDCAVTSANATFSRPMKNGYVTSFIGYRWGSFHRGIDLGSKTGRNTALYSIGSGVIKDIWNDAYGAKCVTVQYKDLKGVYYTAIYAHLSRYASGIYEGMKVSSNTILGYMGDTGKAYGVHLHLEVWPCRIYQDSSCRTWSKYSNFAASKFKQGFKGAESVINFPSKTYSTWYSK